MGGENGIGQLRLFGLRKERRLIMVAGLMEVCVRRPRKYEHLGISYLDYMKFWLRECKIPFSRDIFQKLVERGLPVAAYTRVPEFLVNRLLEVKRLF
ncbi:hypothetical protein J7K07_00400 [Candidatus Bathyarchaeota archaeon]|nr:hypothetical protein [Candidatus Bathyarchaeota archaeon]